MVEPRISTVISVLFCTCLISSSVKGIQVGEGDIPITEGSTRTIFVRRQNRASSLSLTVFVTTTEGYKQQTQCNIALSTVLGRNETDIDPAEDGDLSTREHSLLFDNEETEASFTLEVVDDNIAENDEIFIIYTSVIEDPEDNCARAVLLRDNDEIQFSFSTPVVEISEGDDLPSQLSIIKNGQHEPDISFQVTITPGTPEHLDENDYVPNADYTYTFTNETNELPIATQLREDQSSESIETFSIYLPPRYSPSIAENGDPSGVRVDIIDDDSLLIGFSNSSVTVTEGGPNQRVCVEVKSAGLQLDPSDFVPLTLRIESLDKYSEVEFGQEQFQIADGRMITCKSISAVDDDVSDGTHTSRLITATRGTDIPVEVHPESIPITIRDDDVISFELVVNTDQSRGGPKATPSLFEGNRTQNFIRIIKNGSTTFAYNVNFKVEPLTESSNPSKILITPVTVGVSDSERDIHLEIPDNKLPEKLMQYRISIASIEPFEPDSNHSIQGALTNIVGEGIELKVYDNDYNISFPTNSVTVNEEGSPESVCVDIQGLDSSGIPPMLRIPLSITILNTSAVGGLHISTSQITLSPSMNDACFDVDFSVDNDVCDQSPRRFTAQLMPTPDPEYTINFLQQNITVDIDDSQDCASGVCAACIAVPVIIVILIILLLIVVAIILWRYYKHSKRYHPKFTEEKRNKYLTSQLEKASGNGLESTDSIVPMEILPEKGSM